MLNVRSIILKVYISPSSVVPGVVPGATVVVLTVSVVPSVTTVVSLIVVVVAGSAVVVNPVRKGRSDI
jgi:hypothetical protein